VKWSGVEWSGVEWSGVEGSGVEGRGEKRREEKRREEKRREEKRREENCTVLGYHADNCNNFLPTFRKNLSTSQQNPEITLYNYYVAW
jgi:hypothetical protein